jgi:hypothetical protein
LTLTFLVFSILGLIVILLLSVWLYSYYQAVSAKLEVQSCRNSIAAHAFLVSSTNREVFTDIKCPTRQLLIDTTDDKKAKKTIADDMMRCWYEWGEGNGQYFEGDGVFCFICSQYYFKQADKKISGFAQYLATTPMSGNFGILNPNRLTYQDYLSGFKTPKVDEIENEANVKNIMTTNMVNDNIDTSKVYSTIFVYASGKAWIPKVLEGQKTAIATGGGLVVMGGVAATAAGTVGIMSSLGAAAIAGTLNAWNPVGWIILAGVGVVAIGAGAGAIYTSMAAANSEPQWISFVAFRPYDADSIAALGCQKIDVNQMSHSTKSG